MNGAPISDALNYVRPYVAQAKEAVCDRVPFLGLRGVVDVGESVVSSVLGRTNAVQRLDALVSPYCDAARCRCAPWATAYAEGRRRAQESRKNGRPYTVASALGLLSQTVTDTTRQGLKPQLRRFYSARKGRERRCVQ